MAKRDVVNYYISVQSQYLEMLQDVKDYEEALKNGFFSQEQYDQVQEMIAKVKENYERLSFIIALLNEPARDSKKDKHKKRNALVYDYLSDSSDEYIKSENDDILKKLKEIIKDAKEKKNG